MALGLRCAASRHGVCAACLPQEDPEDPQGRSGVGSTALPAHDWRLTHERQHPIERHRVCRPRFLARGGCADDDARAVDDGFARPALRSGLDADASRRRAGGQSVAHQRSGARQVAAIQSGHAGHPGAARRSARTG